MSNLIKSGFVALSDDNCLVIDSNKMFQGAGRVIRSLDDQKDDLEDLELDDILADESLKDAAYEQQKAYADVLVKEAKAEAEQLVSEARAQAAVIMEDAKKQGYDEGYAQGESRAKEAMEQQLSEAKRKLAEDKELYEKQMFAEKELFLQSVEPKMADIAARLITRLTGILTEDHKEVMTYLIDMAMRDIDDCHHFVIKVSEEDYDYVAEHAADIYGFTNPSVTIEIFADARLLKNQCLIETDNGIINCSLDVQLDNLSKDIRMLSCKEQTDTV